MTSIRHDRLSRVMALLQSRVKTSHDEIFSVGEYTSNRTFQNDLYYLRGMYGANIRYDNHERLYVMETAGAFHLNLKITKAEVEALTAGLGMSAHYQQHLRKPAESLWEKLRNYLPADIISHGTEIVRSTMAAPPVAEVDAEVFSTLLEAKRSRSPVNILYAAPGRMPKQWELSPYYFYFRGNARYMAFFNHKYSNTGIHRVSRIISAKVSDGEYIPPEESGFTDEYILSAWHVIPGFERIPIKVRIT